VARFYVIIANINPRANAILGLSPNNPTAEMETWRDGEEMRESCWIEKMKVEDESRRWRDEGRGRWHKVEGERCSRRKMERYRRDG
jgi:hypothetical protein